MLEVIKKIMGDSNISMPSFSEGGSSPSSIYTYIIFREWCSWSDRVSGAENKEAIDRATAVLISICPDINKREELWELYSKTKGENGDDSLTAATVTAGGLMSHLSMLLEFTSTAYGGF
jgi:hypothetical protein